MTHIFFEHLFLIFFIDLATAGSSHPNHPLIIHSRGLIFNIIEISVCGVMGAIDLEVETLLPRERRWNVNDVRKNTPDEQVENKGYHELSAHPTHHQQQHLKIFFVPLYLEPSRTNHCITTKWHIQHQLCKLWPQATHVPLEFCIFLLLRFRLCLFVEKNEVW